MQKKKHDKICMYINTKIHEIKKNYVRSFEKQKKGPLNSFLFFPFFEDNFMQIKQKQKLTNKKKNKNKNKNKKKRKKILIPNLSSEFFFFVFI